MRNAEFLQAKNRGSKAIIFNDPNDPNHLNDRNHQNELTSITAT
jgi:hypothetical protein